MATLKIIGSSSKGNCYAIICDAEILVLECGCRLFRLMKAIDYHGNWVSACLFSHKHSDHYKYAEEYQKRFRGFVDIESIIPKETFMVGNFTIMPIPLMHTNNDGSPCKNYGYIIKHKDFGSLFFGTDTYAYPTVVKGCNFYMVEANYSDKLLDSDTSLNKSRKERILISHMSIDYTLKYLERCEAEKSDGIILIHLSSAHSNANEFMKITRNKFGVPTYIADAGVEINLTPINQLI